MIRPTTRWTHPAIGDLLGIRAWIAKDAPATARRVAASSKDSVEKLESMPYRGRPGRAVGTRELVLAGWPWIVVYEVGETQVTFLRILHRATII